MEQTREVGTKRQRTRDQLLVAAQQILLEEGAQGLALKEVAHRAGMVHATFYNYFDSIPALLDDLASLFLVTHGVAVRRWVGGIGDPALVFARTTHLSLGYFSRARGYGTVLFDSGLPVDRLAQGLRAPLRGDLDAGRAAGRFVIGAPDMMVGLITGAVIGLALDLHRGRLAQEATGSAVEGLLRLMGVPAEEAGVLARPAIDQPDPPELPLRWMALASG